MTSDERVLDVTFSDNARRVISVPLVWYPRLLNATPAQRRNWKIAGGRLRHPLVRSRRGPEHGRVAARREGTEAARSREIVKVKGPTSAAKCAAEVGHPDGEGRVAGVAVGRCTAIFAAAAFRENFGLRTFRLLRLPEKLKAQIRRGR